MYKLKEEKKTSKEILSELFDSFNATPPSSPLIHTVGEDRVVLGPNLKIEPKIKLEIKKEKESSSKKKHKKDKKKKKKKEKKKKHEKKSKKKKKRKHRSCSSSDTSTTSDSDSDVDRFLKGKAKKEALKSDNDSKSNTDINKLINIKLEKSERKVVVVKDELVGSSKNIVVSVPSEVESKTKDVSLINLPDVIPMCKTEGHGNVTKLENSNILEEQSTAPKVADIFVEELLESSSSNKLNSAAEKPKVNIKITDLKKINILELAEQKKAEEEKEKAEKYEEGEITTESSEAENESALPTLRPVESDNDVTEESKEKKECKVKKCSRKKSHKSSLRKRSRSSSRTRSKKRSRSKDKYHSKRSRSRSSRDRRSKSRSRSRKRYRSPSVEWKRERKVFLDRSSHRCSRKDKLDSKRDENDDKRKDKYSDKDKHVDKERDKEKDRDKDRKRNKSKSPLQLPSMMVQDNPNKKRRSRSRTRSGLEIDKKKLLEIARKNALSMLKQQGGSLTTVTDPAKVATTITAGGKTVDELTDFCKALSQKEGRDEIELSPISDSSDEENEKAFHHPFLLKDRPNNIVMNIRNCTALPVKTHQEKTAEAASQLRLQFPVSSGTHHRKTENEWVPVEPKKEEPPAPVPPPKQTKGGHPRITAPPPDPPQPIDPPLPPPQEIVSVFPTVEDQSNINIGDVVGQKLAALKRLQDNPFDYAAMHLLRNAEDKLNRWNEVNQLSQPGLFTGSTGARLLTPAELASGQQAWAKKDQLMCAQPVTEGIGKSLLQKMGWKPGEGLGKNHEGTLEPLSLPLKMDKRGLVTAEEMKKPPRQFVGSGNSSNPRHVRKPVVKSLEGKHPVSLLLEYCSKRHINPPVFNLIDESGPSHKKMFLFKVEVNGMAYQPPCASNNKKQAKSEAAMICLRALGLMPCTTAPSATSTLLQSA